MKIIFLLLYLIKLITILNLITMGMLLDRKALLSKAKLQIAKVELDGEDYVFVREMTGHDRETYEKSMIKERKDEKGDVVGYDRSMDDFRAKLAVATVCDEAGNLLLKPEDAPQLSKCMSASNLDKIVIEAQKINKITEEEKQEIVKNSDADLKDNSNSGSVEN